MHSHPVIQDFVGVFAIRAAPLRVDDTHILMDAKLLTCDICSHCNLLTLADVKQ